MQDTTINRVVFDREMMRVTNNFKFFSDNNERIDIFYNRLKHLSLECFTRIIDDIVANSKTAPVLDDFVNRIDQFGGVKISKRVKEAASIERLKESGKSCKFCNRTGYVRMFRKENIGFGDYNYSYTFKCSCEYGRQRIDCFEVFDSRLYQQGFELFRP